MGGGVSYSTLSRGISAQSKGYFTQSVEQTFSQRHIDPKMNPKGVKIRECRDSEAHPNSLAIIVGLDVTGSMEYIPGQMVKDGLPSMVDQIMKAGIPNPQVLFMGLGDHKCDNAPLQIGQFETSDDLMDYWLTHVWLEGHGGGNGGESYSLAHYFAGYHTSIDCFEKRGQKGFLFTIGDEPNHLSYAENSMANLMGPGEYHTYTAKELIAKAQETYHVYHFNIDRGYDSVNKKWVDLLGERCILVQNHEEIPGMIAKIVSAYTSDENKVEEVVVSTNPTSPVSSLPGSTMML